MLNAFAPAAGDLTEIAKEAAREILRVDRVLDEIGCAECDAAPHDEAQKLHARYMRGEGLSGDERDGLSAYLQAKRKFLQALSKMRG